MNRKLWKQTIVDQKQISIFCNQLRRISGIVQVLFSASIWFLYFFIIFSCITVHFNNRNPICVAITWTTNQTQNNSKNQANLPPKLCSPPNLILWPTNPLIILLTQGWIPPPTLIDEADGAEKLSRTCAAFLVLRGRWKACVRIQFSPRATANVTRFAGGTFNLAIKPNLLAGFCWKDVFLSLKKEYRVVE